MSEGTETKTTEQRHAAECAELDAQHQAAKEAAAALPDHCPKCGEETIGGFGLMGGSFGPYVLCGVEGCDFFKKTALSVEAE